MEICDEEVLVVEEVVEGVVVVGVVGLLVEMVGNVIELGLDVGEFVFD